ncbi:MAG: type IV pilus modification PilV family protein [Terriglobia bacterium]
MRQDLAHQSPERKRRVVSSARQSRERKRPVVLPITFQRGFTLLEALVATAVLGASVAALLGLLSGSLRNAARLEAPEQALLLGQSKLHELISAGVTEENATTNETHALPFDRTLAGRWDERFRWEARAMRFRPAAIPGRDEGSSPERTPGEILLARITLDVFWRPADGQAERKLSFETYQLRREPAE